MVRRFWNAAWLKKLWAMTARKMPLKGFIPGAVTQGASSLEEAVRKVILWSWLPGQATLKLLQIAPLLAAGAIVTDVCSTKKAVMDQAQKVLPPTVAFVGGHPMAGSEKDGVEALDANLFENAIYVITSPEAEALARIKQLVGDLGAIPAEFPPAKHDELVAAVSHLPHLASAALVSAVAGRKETAELQLLAAGGFGHNTDCHGQPADVARYLPDKSRPILLMLDELVAKLRNCVYWWRKAMGAIIYSFCQAKQFRQNIAQDKGILHKSIIYVYVPDHPGVIGEIAGLLGQSGINIAEIELLRVREEEGGPLRFGFKTLKQPPFGG